MHVHVIVHLGFNISTLPSWTGIVSTRKSGDVPSTGHDPMADPSGNLSTARRSVRRPNQRSDHRQDVMDPLGAAHHQLASAANQWAKSPSVVFRDGSYFCLSLHFLSLSVLSSTHCLVLDGEGHYGSGSARGREIDRWGEGD